MELTYKRATINDLDILTETRITVLRAANRLSDDADMGEVRENARRYYEQALSGNSHIAYLVFDGDILVGAGGASLYRVMPTYRNPDGRKAYIMNMYTAPAYRRKGVAYRTLDLLVNDIHERGITFITLEATEMGRPLYEKYGFEKMDKEMRLMRNIREK